MIKTTVVPYSLKSLQMKGFLASSSKEKRPAVLVVHAWKGQDDFVRQKAEELAKLGYVGFAVDMYGDAKQTRDKAIAEEWMRPLFIDRALLQDHIKAAYHCVHNQPQVDPERIGIIGFCFGGLVAIELFRSGVALRGAVSFHGLLGNQRGDVKANTVPIAKDIKGSLLVLHGHDDPLVSQEDICHFQNEFTKANVDWQMHLYSHTLHAFTNPMANDIKFGTVYNEKAAMRSWKAMEQFFNEVL